jgi:cell division septum initiation protein DivIVA
MAATEPTSKAANQYRLPEVEQLLERVTDLIDQARPMPLSTSVVINKDEILDLLVEVRSRLPEELRAARWLLKERDEFLEQARRDADAIVEAARTQAERMVERTEIAREAKRAAEQTVAEAEADARRLRHEAEDFVDARLARFEEMLGRTLGAVRRGRTRLQPDLAAMDAEDSAEDVEEGKPFFDQDGRLES